MLRNVPSYGPFSFSGFFHQCVEQLIKHQDRDALKRGIYWQLLNNGFAEAVEDKEKEGEFHWIKLTDKGRELKALGNFSKHYSWVLNRASQTIAERTRADKLENAQMENQRNMVVLTVILAVGTSIAGVYYLLEIAKSWHLIGFLNLLTAAFVLLAIGIFVLIVMLLLKEFGHLPSKGAKEEA